ncbi:MAG: damage-inducible protein CinA [Legionella sp. 40-6]|nr:CinA family protein [Legionella sp.]OJX93194.1 MAG: damage-inducible protein CinA [Legionella sp. 40-6]
MNNLPDLILELADKLQKRQWLLVTAESCTGGLVSAALTEIPGSSLWFERGFITYSNAAKEELLDVPSSLLRQYGAVSEEVAAAMAEGALTHSKGHFALSVTGIAGPEGGTPVKPVGTVCFGWIGAGIPVHTCTKQFSGTRQDIRMAACYEALVGIKNLL